MNTSDILNKAADLIEQRGWVQGESGWGIDQPAGAPLCLEGGIVAALGIDALDAAGSGRAEFKACPAYQAMSTYLDERMLFLWNDRSPRTASEVIEVLRACAVIESSRERETAAVS